jgi:hypothetical protein
MARFKQIVRACLCAFLLLIVLAVYAPPHGFPELKNYRDLSNAKQIYLGLKIYAGDHDGKFPSALPDGSPITTANQAYRLLVPDYIPKETIFYSEGSAWTPKEPDNDIVGDRKLAAGENAFAYVSNLTEVSNGDLPLVMTAFAEARPGVYGDNPAYKGGIPKGHGIVYVAVDGSGRLLRVKRKEHAASNAARKAHFVRPDDQSSGDCAALKGQSPQLQPITVERENDGPGLFVRAAGRDIFSTDSGWLAPNQVPLNPE